VPNGLHRPEKVLSASSRIRRFILEKVFSIGLKSVLYGGRYLIPARFSACWTGCRLVCRRVVHDQEVVGSDLLGKCVGYVTFED